MIVRVRQLEAAEPFLSAKNIGRAFTFWTNLSYSFDRTRKYDRIDQNFLLFIMFIIQSFSEEHNAI